MEEKRFRLKVEDSDVERYSKVLDDNDIPYYFISYNKLIHIYVQAAYRLKFNELLNNSVQESDCKIGLV